MNLRLQRPERCALLGCATLIIRGKVTYCPLVAIQAIMMESNISWMKIPLGEEEN